MSKSVLANKLIFQQTIEGVNVEFAIKIAHLWRAFSLRLSLLPIGRLISG
jgi:hypothetical protein